MAYMLSYVVIIHVQLDKRRDVDSLFLANVPRAEQNVITPT